MSGNGKFKLFFLFLGDVVVLYAALVLTLILRYDGHFFNEFFVVQGGPFTVIFAVWLLVFYVAGLYDLRRLRNNIEFFKTLALSLITNAILAALIFYLVPVFGIAPKTNLFLCIVLVAVIQLFWRRIFNRLTASGEMPNRVVLVGDGPAASEIEQGIIGNPQFGYAVVAHLTEDVVSQSPQVIDAAIREHRANLVVVPRELKRRSAVAPKLYALFGQGISVIDLDSFYETIMRKVPLADIEETWLLENIEAAAKFYDQLKHAFEFLFALMIALILLPVEILIGILVKLTSRGPAIYRQVRTGKNGREFTLYKFRTMRMNAEANGAQWAVKNDGRVTSLGRVLRSSHLDELPQLVNIIRGDLSFVGPRPERPEIIKKLKEQIPFYEIRLLVAPGITGWAQIHYRADLNLEDVKQKLQYDIYYLKNRSLILDIAVVLKTLKLFFVNPE